MNSHLPIYCAILQLYFILALGEPSDKLTMFCICNASSLDGAKIKARLDGEVGGLVAGVLEIHDP